MVPISYIIFESLDGIEFPIIFTQNISHDDMARRMLPHKVISAGKIGKCDRNEEYHYGIFCHGKSVTLGIESRGYKDTKLIQSWFNMDC